MTNATGSGTSDSGTTPGRGGDPVSMLSARLGAGEQLLLGWCAIGDASIAQSLARVGFDAVLLDMQHGAFDPAQVRLGIAVVALAGKSAVVRIPIGDFATASAAFDAGAAGVVAPMINSAAEARMFVEFTKFPPLGGRSWGPTPALALTGMTVDEYLHAANRIHLAIAMIETRQALDSLDEILEVDGLDGILIGPSDLSLALSGGARVDPNGAEVTAALDQIVDACRRHHKIAAAFCADGQRARQLFNAGFQLCSAGTDGALLEHGARAALDAARGQA